MAGGQNGDAVPGQVKENITFATVRPQRKVPEIRFPVSIWPHAIVQLLAFLLYILVLHGQEYLPALTFRFYRLEQMPGHSELYLPVILWVIFIFLLGEVIVRRSQNLAATVFPKKEDGFRLVTMLAVILLLHIAFVTLECVLFRIMTLADPLYSEQPMRFLRAWKLTLVMDAPLMVIFALGEVLRQAWYKNAIRRWHQEHARRKQLPEFTEDEL